MAADVYRIQKTTLDAIGDSIRAKTGKSALIPPDDMPEEIESISGGTEITDGIVVKARDANGYATSATLYGSTVYPDQFWNRTTSDGTWIHLETLLFHDVVTLIKGTSLKNCGSLQALDFSHVQKIENSAFMECRSLVNADMPELTSIGQFAFATCVALQTVNAPKCTNFNSQRIFSGCMALTSVTLGSIGHGITGIQNQTFLSCSQTGMTITIYTTGSYADTAVANTRNGATNATIIIKAAEATTYNGTTYAAGDTILTSEVVS